VSLNYFELFGLTPTFDVDSAALETSFRKLQSDSHPDRFVTATASEKLAAMQTATNANEAYLTLKSPGLRGAYLLGLSGIVAVDEKNNQMPADFLMQQMEWREAVEDAENAHDISALETLLDTIASEAKQLQMGLSTQFKQNQLADATDSTRKLIFMDKVRADIIKAIEKLED
jgi:molecular chaperone HscB